MKTTARLTLALLCISLAAGLRASDPPLSGQMQVSNGPQLTFADAAVSATGLTHSGPVALASFTIDPHDYTAPTVTYTARQTAAADGSITFAIAAGVKPRSIWLLVDQTSGAYTVAGAAGSVLMPFSIPPGNFDAEFKNITVPRAHTEVFFVRKNGTFELQDVKDGGVNDKDGGFNGSVLVTTSTKGKTGDVLFVVDFLTLDFFVKVV